MSRLARGLAVAVICSLLSAPAGAQSAEHLPVARLIPEMIVSAARLAPGTQGDRSEDFVASARGVTAVDSLNRSLGLQVASFPLGPTATNVLFGGGVERDGGARFVSGYSEGAATLGRGRRTLAVTYQDSTYAALDGLDLRGSSINVFVTPKCCTGALADRDLLQETLSLRLHRRVVGFVIGYGVNDRFDVGAVVPFVEVAADARVEARILRTATAADPSIHEFDPIGLANRTIPSGHVDPPEEGIAGTGNSTARGFGDIVLRGKLRLRQSATHQVAVGLDLKMPTGNSDDFIGLGATQATPAVMWSMEAGRAGGRIRVQYTKSFGSLSSLLAAPGADLKVPNELGYEAGFDFAVAPRVTFVADVIGRRVPEVAGFDTANTTFTSRGPGPLPSSNFVAVDNLQEIGRRTINTVLGSMGARFYLGGPLVANARVLFPVGNVGLRPAPRGVFTLDYAF
jgi:hypothetical protein